MHKGYEDDDALCEWLRENSSGCYRLAAHAAERIEMLRAALVRTKIAARKAQLHESGHECDCKSACRGIEQVATHELYARTS